MNYPANTILWGKGALVIHDCDAKSPRMLMRVIGYRSSDSYCQTEYLDAELQKEWGAGRKSKLFNPIKFLHDSKLWGLPEKPDPMDPMYERSVPWRGGGE